jgi:uncharacterized protein YecT (DUF1311 family)
MSVGETMKQALVMVLLCFGLLGFGSARALDNPDSLGLLAAFEQREQPYRATIDDPANNSRDYARAYHAYQQFLDAELNRVYGDLRRLLPPAAADALRDAQRHWLAFRDTEFDFIAANWNRHQFGSSAPMSQGAYRCALIRARVVQLLAYRINY